LTSICEMRVFGCLMKDAKSDIFRIRWNPVWIVHLEAVDRVVHVLVIERNRAGEKLIEDDAA
jgi:hypothetical protein